MSSPLGTELKRSKYRLLGLVGQGQFGRVFCAVHRQTGRLVALKNLERQRFSTHKFLRELRFLLSLRHPNIVTCHALEHTSTGRYLVMDYCEGGTLRSLMEEDMRLSLPQSIKLILDILLGLDHAHSRGIVHCDIKPENILLNVQPTGWSAHISDFGIARLSRELEDPEGTGNTGSPAYMAPERFYGQYSISSDIYSVGVMLFELLTGYRPFSGTPAELMSAHLNRPLKLPDSIPEVWHPILSRSMQKLAARRFRSAGEMLQAVQAICVSENLMAKLEPSAVHLPLLQPTGLLSVCPFVAQSIYPLSYAVTCLAMVSVSRTGIQLLNNNPSEMKLLAGGLNQLILRSWTNPASPRAVSSASIEQRTQAAAPLKDVLLRPHGWFVITDAAIYRVSPQDASNADLPLEMVASIQDARLATVEAQGRWLATVTTTSHARCLTFTGLETERSPVALATQCVPLTNRGATADLRCLLAIDACHVAVISSLKGDTTTRKGHGTSTVIDIYARRGDRLGALTVPLSIGQIHPTCTPYRLMATDEYNPRSLVLIDIKPFRVLRFGAEIVPRFLVSTSWGYLLMDEAGQIVLLDDYGQQVSRIDGPPHPTAILSFGQYYVLIATWDGDRGNLYTLDLRELNVDLLF